MSTAPGSTSRPGFVRRHKVVAILLALLLLLVAAVGGFALLLNARLGDIDRFESGLDPAQRAQQPTGTAADAQNILLLGADDGTSESISKELADGEWTPGAFRSDTMMILHLPADRDRAFLVSLPRDSYVQIPGFGQQKLNSAFSYGGPDLAVRTIEDLTGVYLDHVAMVDWAGFRDLTNAIGGVQVTVAETFRDPRSGRTWRAGTHQLRGNEALEYVRTRYGMQDGDVDRIRRQQNFLRAVLSKTVSQGTLTNPVRLSNLTQAVADATTVDSDFSPAKMRSLATSLRDLRSGDVAFLTAPTRGYDDIDGVGSVVLLDEREGSALWRSVRRDDVQRYLDEYDPAVLPDAASVR